MIIKMINFLIGKISPKDISNFIGSISNILTPEQKKALGDIALKAIEAAAAGAIQGATKK
jgi:hypothetical protein